MEEIHRIHKEPAWGWMGLLAAALGRRALGSARTRQPSRAPSAVTPWSRRSPLGWSA